jgi:(2R)-3-sulfolactate dehydrogenase (NADP+)
MSDTIISLSDLKALVQAALVANRTSAAAAASVADALVMAEADGQPGHGVSRVPAYAAQSANGKVDGAAVAEVHKVAGGVLRVDARGGFAFPAIDAALQPLAELAGTQGIAMAAVHRSHHCGVLGWHVERLAARGLVALMVANSPGAMAPWGGRKALFGTNPIAFAAPVPGRDPVVIDLSLSKVARGKIMLAAQKGEGIPGDWALDAAGRPTTDAKAALAGTLLPMADAKGAALAMAIEILAAAVPGALFAYEAPSFLDDKGANPAVGQCIIAIQARAASGGAYGDRIAALVREVAADGEARIPGGRRFESQAQGRYRSPHGQARLGAIKRATGDRRSCWT